MIRRYRNAIAAPLGLAVFFAHFLGFDGVVYACVALPVLILAVFASVHHADEVAHDLGDPLGSLVLAIAVTVIELGLVISLMLAGGTGFETLARDVVFSGAMITLNGITGACLFVGSLRHGEQSFSIFGVSSALSALAAILILALVLPNYTVTAPGPFYSAGQLVFIALVSLILYGTFLLIQTVRHKDYFSEGADPGVADHKDERPRLSALIRSLIFLSAGLAAVVLVAESLSPFLESVVVQFRLPHSLVGVVIAMITLMPEGISALQAGRRNHLQKSLNLALGSSLASIGLMIPIVAVFSLATGLPLALGLNPKESILLVLSLFVASLSLGTGKTTVLQGMVHLVIFAVYLFLTIVP